MINLKTLVATTLALGSFHIFAGEFSKIDLVVREELESFFGVSYSNIWGLNVVDNEEGCTVTVKAYVQQQSQWGEGTYETRSCVKRVQVSPYSIYESEVIDFQLISN